MVKEDIKKEISKLKKERLELFKKDLFLLALSNLLFLSSLKISDIGLPYYKDSKKKYNISVTTLNNYNNKKVIDKYLYNKDLNDIKNKTNKIYIKDTYEYKDNIYKREVKVYKLEPQDNYESILQNYQKYIKKENIIDEYQEKNNNINKKYSNEKEIVVKYYTINKRKYIKVYESDLKNITCSVLYTIFSAISLIIVSCDFIYSSDYITEDIKKLKKIKENS